jgi:hypothetical protein
MMPETRTMHFECHYSFFFFSAGLMTYPSAT